MGAAARDTVAYKQYQVTVAALMRDLDMVHHSLLIMLLHQQLASAHQATAPTRQHCMSSWSVHSVKRAQS
jgi:hypothetical protein